MTVNKRFTKRRNSRKMRSRRTKRVGNCHMVHDMSYQPPCQGVLMRGGGDVTYPAACNSYQIDVTQGNIGGQPLVSGNPSGCLDTQMHNFSRGQDVQLGGGACSGYTFNFDQNNQIAGQPVIVPHYPNCPENFQETSHLAGGGRHRGKKKGRGKVNKNKKPSKRTNRSLKKAIEKFCRRRRKPCSKTFKKKLYNKVQGKLCN